MINKRRIIKIIAISIILLIVRSAASFLFQTSNYYHADELACKFYKENTTIGKNVNYKKQYGDVDVTISGGKQSNIVAEVINKLFISFMIAFELLIIFIFIYNENWA